jgi:hypothetical protein
MLPKSPNAIGDPEHHHEDDEAWDDYEINMNNVVYVEDNADDGNTDDKDSHDEYEADGDIDEADDGGDDEDDKDRRLISNLLQKKRLIPNGIYDIEEMHADYRELVDPKNIFNFDGHDYYHVKDEDDTYDEAEEVDDGKEEKDDDDKGQSCNSLC